MSVNEARSSESLLDEPRLNESLIDEPSLDEPTLSKEQDAFWMAQALKQADVAASHGEIPVGAIVVCDGKVVGKGFNRPISSHDATAHAEIMALREAGKTLGNYRLVECTLYVTLEPCPMCAGALVHSRVKRLVYGADDNRTGCAGSLMDLLNHDGLNHQVDVTSGVLGERCSSELSAFFKKRRDEKKKHKKSLQS